MANRADLRQKLINKLRDAADNLGKTEFSTAELNEMLENAPRRLYPNVYKLTESTALSADSKGRVDLTSESFTADQVTRVWDSDDALFAGWSPRGTSKLTGFNQNQADLVAEYIEPYTITSAHEATDTGIPDQYLEMVVLAAAIDGLERLAADRTDFKGYQPSGESGVDENEILNAIDTLQRQLEREVATKHMSMPAFGV